MSNNKDLKQVIEFSIPKRQFSNLSSLNFSKNPKDLKWNKDIKKYEIVDIDVRSEIDSYSQMSLSDMIKRNIVPDAVNDEFYVDISDIQKKDISQLYKSTITDIGALETLKELEHQRLKDLENQKDNEPVDVKPENVKPSDEKSEVK